VLTGKHEKKQMQSDVDARLNRFFFELLEGGRYRGTAAAGFHALWRQLNHSGDNSDSTADLADSSTVASTTTTSLLIGDQPGPPADAVGGPSYAARVVDFVTGCSQDQEIVICYSCHNIFTSAEFAVHEAATCEKKMTVVATVAADAPPSARSEYRCPKCDKCFTKLFNLKQHVRIHTGERPLQCTHCDSRFADRSSMNKHQRTVHERVRPHKCVVCLKGFPSTSHLNDHMASHSGEKNFACQLCSRTFSFRTSLKKHLATHSDERPFKCRVCLKWFKTKSNIRAHMAKVHRLPLNRFNCEDQSVCSGGGNSCNTVQ